MHCVNPNCRREINDAAIFCPHCAANQRVSPGAQVPTELADERAEAVGLATRAPASLEVSSAGIGERAADTQPGGPSPRGSSRPTPGTKRLKPESDSVEHLIIRPADEPEGEVLPGAKRHLVVLDERSIHFADVPENGLLPERLLEDVRGYIVQLKAPVETRLVEVAWHTDPKESRKRVVAWLRGHEFASFKMVLGVDYMGCWADVRIAMAHQPDPIPTPPVEGAFVGPPLPAPVVAIIILLLGLMVLFIGAMAENTFVIAALRRNRGRVISRG